MPPRWVNRLMGMMLRSPFGRLIPGVMLISYRGRRSGRRLSTPVEYVRAGDRVVVVVGRAKAKQWWRNVRADPEVDVHLEGSDRHGRATVHDAVDAEAIDDLAVYVTRRPSTAKALGIGPDGLPDRSALAQAASSTVTVRIDLAPAA